MCICTCVCMRLRMHTCVYLCVYAHVRICTRCNTATAASHRQSVRDLQRFVCFHTHAAPSHFRSFFCVSIFV